AFDGEVLVHAVHRDHHPGDRHLLRDVHARTGAAGEDLRPALAHLVLTRQARAGGVHADDLLVLRPHRHHALEVAVLERFVEGVLRVLGGREDLGAHAGRFWISWSTVSTVISRMQRKWPSGHTRSKHGLHSTPSQMTRAAPESGGVCLGLEEPK